MSEDLAKNAIVARQQLEQALLAISDTLTAAASALQTSSEVLQAAAEHEAEAHAQYVAYLERRLAQQSALS